MSVITPRTMEEFENAIRSEIDSVRMGAAVNRGFKPTEEMALIGLNDPNVNVRSAWADRGDYPLNVEIMETMMLDSSFRVRLSASYKKHKPTDRMLIIALHDLLPSVVISWLKRDDWTPTPEQIKEGLGSENKDIVNAWVDKLKRISEQSMQDAGACGGYTL